MNPAFYTAIFLFIIAFIIRKQNQDELNIFSMLKNKRKKIGVKVEMNELVSKYIGKECVVTTMNNSATGFIRSVQDNWLEIENDGKTDIINLDFIIKISEYPRRKNGKKKVLIGE